MKTLLKLKNITTIFKEKNANKIVHNSLNLEIYEGEALSIIGENGCGKTTLAKILVGLVPLSDGEIEVADDFKLKGDIGIQFQTEDKTSDIIKPRNLIKFYSKFYETKIEDEELDRAIKIFGLEEFMDRRLNKLSGGQRQRLNLLLAIINKPKLLILDEFTTGLDIISVMSILEYIQEFVKKNNSTLIVITHSPKEIKLLADRVVLIKDGVIKSEHKKEDIIKNFDNDFDDFLLKTIRGDK